MRILAARRYADAARNLRARQIVYRARRLAPAQVLAVGLPERTPHARADHAAGLFAAAAAMSGPQSPPHLSARFCSSGRERCWGAPLFWSDKRDGLLFLFQLHGFGDLADYLAGPRDPHGDAFWREVIEDWLEHHRRPAYPQWHPYPLSGRLLAWLSAMGSGLLDESALRLLLRQAFYLKRCVEHDVGGNHVLRNATALTASGYCLDERRLLMPGIRLLGRELARQLLSDGGHEERSPSYHREVLADLDSLATIISRAGAREPEWLSEARASLCAWLRVLAGPDGRVPRFSDSWDGPMLDVEPDRPAVEELAESGYLVVRHGGDQAVFDVGPLGPRHLPAHAHADALGFVVWFDGRPFIVDPGAGSYSGAVRECLRSTGVHSTVALDGLNQCDFWGTFRAASLPAVKRGPLRFVNDAVVVSAWHDGYRPSVHRRTFCWMPGDGLVVVDVLEGGNRRAVSARLPLAPDAGSPVTVNALGPGPQARLVDIRVAPYVGCLRPSRAWERQLVAAPDEPFGWSLLRPGATAVLDERTVRLRRRSGEELAVAI